ncbi:DoxX family protein [Cyclobacterium amurskyense]|uniref:Membrane protein n=1 Tax=Cyclobacterium amurskyense TaxID=320787 RepID=A0A0H4PVP8_9BACT|nr:membrane protein [Cyclobacterium amurskyense]AKP52457.1 Membrane protein [Cyclobacterium amurskyense]|tara:strand:+ start:9991 stop:10443 length:453 start_codon:yes stop_codon:yes gene_type:complete
MKPFILLIAVTILAIGYMKLVYGVYNFSLSARIGLSAMLLFTALGHFLFTEGMAMMIPDFLPFKKELVYFTGLIEIMAAIGLHVPQFRLVTAWLLILFFVLIIPANIKASMEQIDYQNATFEGNGLEYLWFRIPLQILFIGWVYFSSIRI